jgi:hypothetical protein
MRIKFQPTARNLSLLAAGSLLCIPAIGWAQEPGPPERPERDVTADEAPDRGDIQNRANSPLTPEYTLQVQDYYAPDLHDNPGAESNQFIMRGVVPHELFGQPQIFRGELPIITAPTETGHTTAIGDLTMFDLFLVKAAGLDFGAGPLLVLPTGVDEESSSGKWQLGAAGMAVAPMDWGLVGGLLTYQHSIGGDDNRAGVSLMTFQPTAFFNLPKGFYLRSSGVWNINFEGGDYIPIGAGAGKVWPMDKMTVNTFIEPQLSVVRNGTNVPDWQWFFGFNVQFHSDETELTRREPSDGGIEATSSNRTDHQPRWADR